MGQIEDAFRDAADEVAQIKAQPSNRYWWLYGTIKKKNENGTLDVAIDGVTIQQVKATVSCMMANVGDRVIVLKAGPLMTCVDVIATSDDVKVPASSITGTLPESALPTASTTAKGIMQVGSGLTVIDGKVSVDNWAYVKNLVESSTDWEYIWRNAESDRFVRWRVLMGICYVEAVRVNGVGSGGWKAGTIPDSALPSNSLYTAACEWNNNNTAQIWVGGLSSTESRGEVWLYNNGTEDVYGSVSWPVDL